MSAQLAENLGKVLNTNGEDQNSYESKKTAGQVDMMKNTLILAYQKCTLGGTKNTNFRNSMGALSNPISFAIRISKQFLFSF